METFVKIGFAKISLAAQKKSELPKIWEGKGGGGRGGGSPQLPRPVRSWVLSPVSSCKHIIISVKFDIIELGL